MRLSRYRAYAGAVVNNFVVSVAVAVFVAVAVLVVMVVSVSVGYPVDEEVSVGDSVISVVVVVSANKAVTESDDDALTGGGARFLHGVSSYPGPIHLAENLLAYFVLPTSSLSSHVKGVQ